MFPKISGLGCGPNAVNLIGTVCTGFKATFLRLKWQFCPLHTKKCNRYLSSSTSLNELALDQVPQTQFLVLYLNAC